DQKKEAQTLVAAVLELVHVFEPIDPAHFGTMARPPVLLKKVEKMQAEVMKMKDAGDDKGKALAPTLGTGTTLSVSLGRLHDKLNQVKAAQKAAHKAAHHH